MKNTDWKKITQRPLNSEEKKEYGDEVEFMWDGKTPELDEEVLVYTTWNSNRREIAWKS
ncbi:TPA: hypothetical protein ACGWMI_000079 [Streptococcus agalactiae]